MDRIRLGVVGLGRGFMLTLPALTGDERIVLAGAFDPRAEARERFMQEFDAPAFPTLGAMLGAPDIDALYIASPHEHHAAQAIAAIKAGKHVLVEKPMAVTVADCAAMAEAARRFDRVLVVGPSHGFDAPVRAAAALIASGDHGALRQILTFNFTDFVYRPRRAEELDAAAKLARTYGNGAPPPPAPHHEHFGFVLASCERADIRLTPTGLALYADHAHEWRPLDPPAVPRRAVIDEFVAAIHRTSAPIHDGRWGLETMAACAALIESSRRGTDIFPATIIHDALEQIAL